MLQTLTRSNIKNKTDLPLEIRELRGSDLILSNTERKVLASRKKYNKLLNSEDDDIDDLIFAARDELYAAKRVLGKGYINSTLVESAKTLDIFILTRPINKGAYSFIGHNSVLKPNFIKLKSAKSGIIKGLIPVNQSLLNSDESAEIFKKQEQHIKDLLRLDKVDKIPFLYQDEFLVIRNGKSIFTKTPKLSDEIVEVLTDNKGNYYTSDIDLFSLGIKEPSNIKIREYKNYGHSHTEEIEIIRVINEIFKENDNSSVKRNLVLHGSEAFNPNPLEIDYPIRAFTPKGRVFDIPKGPSNDQNKFLRVFFHWVEDQGYYLNRNPSWDF